MSLGKEWMELNLGRHLFVEDAFKIWKIVKWAKLGWRRRLDAKIVISIFPIERLVHFWPNFERKSEILSKFCCVRHLQSHKMYLNVGLLVGTGGRSFFWCWLCVNKADISWNHWFINGLRVILDGVLHLLTVEVLYKHCSLCLTSLLTVDHNRSSTKCDRPPMLTY